MCSFADDYKFILSLRYYESGRDYVAINSRLLNIIEKYDNNNTEYGKYAWLLGHAYFYLQRQCYRSGVITNFEKYLQSEPFTENYKDTHIRAFANDRNIIKLPKTSAELEHAKLTHFQEIYYLLAKTCQQENEITKAKKYAKLGMNILPNEQFLFYYELYEIYRKANELPYFIKLCDNLTSSEKRDFSNMIDRAQQLINSNYVYRPRGKPIQ